MNDSWLYGWKTGALEPPDALRVEEALRVDPLLMARALSLPEVEVASTPALRIPPRGWGLSCQVLEAEVFSEGLRPGDRFRVVLQEQEGERAVVVLRRRNDWTVVFPERDGQELLLSNLPLEDSERVLDLTADRESGVQLWAVALPTVDRSRAGIDAVLQALGSGDVPMARFQVEVR